jgi:ABC-type spermidine/putrescine transport system permease subunit I
MPEIGPTSTRDAVRWGLLLASVAVAGFRLPGVYRDLRAWHEVRFSDSSAADLYWTNFEVSAIGIVIILCIGVGAFYLMRRANKLSSELVTRNHGRRNN